MPQNDSPLPGVPALWDQREREREEKRGKGKERGGGGYLRKGFNEKGRRRYRYNFIAVQRAYSAVTGLLIAYLFYYNKDHSQITV